VPRVPPSFGIVAVATLAYVTAVGWQHSRTRRIALPA